MSKVLYLTDENFDEFIAASIKPVVIDFWAKWCQPCKQISPILDELSTEREDIIIAKLEVDENPKTAAKYQIRSIPNIMIIKDGKIAAQKLGAGTKSQVSAYLDNNI